MAQIFHRSTNTIARVSIYGAAFLIACWVWAVYELSASPYVTDVNVAKDQPVPFSHKHHVGEVGIWIADTATRRWKPRLMLECRRRKLA